MRALNERLPALEDGAWQLSSDGTQQRRWQRTAIFALSLAGVDAHVIAWFVDCSLDTVRRWLARAETGNPLVDKPRSGRPPTFTEAFRLRTIGFYCQHAPLPGCTGWSLTDAANYLEDHLEILGATVSRASLQRILKSHALRPHLHKYFLQLTDPDFFPKMERIIELYRNPPEHLYNYDECTCIQALRRLTPDLPVEEERPTYEDFDYERNGITDLMAFFEPKTGQVAGECTPNHNRETLCRVFAAHVESLPPEAEIHYVMDNLNTHFHDDFCQTVADLSRVPYSPLKTGAERRQWLQTEEKRLMVHFVPFHASWLNMIEIWFGIFNRKCLQHGSFASVTHLRETIEAFLETWNNSFAHPFDWSYTGDGLHEKAVRRFSKLLLLESNQMDAKFLTSQLLLMSNLADHYRDQVPTRDWHKLVELTSAKADYLTTIIDTETKPKRQQKARHAREHFNDTVPAILTTDRPLPTPPATVS